MHRNECPLFHIVALVTLFILGFSIYSFAWDIEVLESQADRETKAPIVIDSNDIPHTAYFNDLEGHSASIIYAYRRQDSWFKQTVAEHKVEMVGNSHPVLAFDANDNPYIFYRNLLGQLWCIYRSGSGWSERGIGPLARCSPHDAVFDSDNMMSVVYFYYVPPDGWKQGQLRLAVDIGDKFNRTVIEPNGYYPSASLAADSNETLHLSYYDGNNELLVYAVQNGDSWDRYTIENVGGVSDSYGAISLAIDSHDLPHISYYKFATSDLKYAHWNGADWLIQTVDSLDNVGNYSSLALDSHDNPRIAYRDTSNRALKYASFDGSSWQIELVDDKDSSGRLASLALDSHDRPCISHFDGYPNNDIRYATLAGECGDLQHPILPGDIDENCYIDFNDFSRFASWWLLSSCADCNNCQGGDFDKTGTVDANDLSALCSNWLRYTGL
ncbi:MAG: hypothetical protein PVG93_05995 [Phycisphaerales bacterium]|jgi:hypothetical protein